MTAEEALEFVSPINNYADWLDELIGHPVSIAVVEASCVGAVLVKRIKTDVELSGVIMPSELSHRNDHSSSKISVVLWLMPLTPDGIEPDPDLVVIAEPIGWEISSSGGYPAIPFRYKRYVDKMYTTVKAITSGNPLWGLSYYKPGGTCFIVDKAPTVG